MLSWLQSWSFRSDPVFPRLESSLLFWHGTIMPGKEGHAPREPELPMLSIDATEDTKKSLGFHCLVQVPRPLHKSLVNMWSTEAYGAEFNLSLAMQVQFDSCRRLSSRCRICDCVVRCSPRQGIGIQQWHPAMAPYHMALTMTPYHGTQQWHHTMASSNGTTSTLPKCVITTSHLLHPAMAPYHIASSHAYQMASINGIQQWHLTRYHPAMAPYHVRTMAPSNGTTSSLSKCVITAPRLLHPAMAPSNGIRWHLTTWHLAMVPSNGTTSANVCNHPPVLLDVRTPIAKAIWGKSI